MSLPDWISTSARLSPRMKRAKMSRSDVGMRHAPNAHAAEANEGAEGQRECGSISNCKDNFKIGSLEILDLITFQSKF